MASNFQSAILRVYDAQIDDTAWDDVMDQCQAYVGSRGSALVVVDQANTYAWELNVGSEIWRALAPSVAEHIAKFTHFDAEAYLQLAGQPKHWLGLDYKFWTNANLREREDYAFYLQHAGVFRRIASRLNDNKSWMDCITFQYEDTIEIVSDSSQQRIRDLLPHLAKSIEMGRAWRELSARHNAVLAALDHFAIGILVMSRSGHIVVANKEASRMLESDDGIRIRVDGKIRAADNDIDAALQVAIRRAADTSGGFDVSSETLIAISRRSNNPAYLGETFPIRDSQGELNDTGQLCILALIDPNHTKDISVDAMALAYELTDAEKSVCRLVVAGKTNIQIGEIREVGQETVKTQVKKLLSKTNCARRSDLVRLACKTSPPII